MSREESQGTPKDLKEASIHALSGGEFLNPSQLRNVMRDYLAQKFGVAMLRHQSPAAQEAIKDLWFRVTGEKI